MAKAIFHKGERVFVKPVGAWARVENILPQWVKGVEEPLRVHYDVGLGRDFQAHELAPEPRGVPRTSLVETEVWRVARVRNRWHLDAHDSHPVPGTHPVVLTDTLDWGGWRVPAAEYERDPERIEHQARIIANAMRLLRIAKELTVRVGEMEGAAPARLSELASDAEAVIEAIFTDPNAPHRPPPGETPTR